MLNAYRALCTEIKMSKYQMANTKIFANLYEIKIWVTESFHGMALVHMQPLFR